MVWAGLSIYGPTKTYFINEKETVNTAVNCNKILPFAKREGMRLFDGRKYIFQQDGATPHTSNMFQNWCKNNFGQFIPKKMAAKFTRFKPVGLLFLDCCFIAHVFQKYQK